MEKNGQLQVDEYLRVEGQRDVYAIGDCCNSRDIKLGFTAGIQAGLVAANIKKQLAGKKEKPWSPGEKCLEVSTHSYLADPNRFLAQIHGFAPSSGKSWIHHRFSYIIYPDLVGVKFDWKV